MADKNCNIAYHKTISLLDHKNGQLKCSTKYQYLSEYARVSRCSVLDI